MADCDGLGEDYGFDHATGQVVLRACGGEVEVFRDSLVEWIRRPPDFSDSRNEATRNLARAAARLDAIGSSRALAVGGSRSSLLTRGCVAQSKPGP